MGYRKPFYSEGLVRFDNGSFDPKGFVGVKKEDFVKQYAGKVKGDIGTVWSLIVKHRPTKSSKK